MWEPERIKWPLQEEVKGQRHNMLCVVLTYPCRGGVADNLWLLHQTWSTSVKWPHKNKPATDSLAAWEITWTSTVGKYSGKYFPSPPHLPPLQLWYMVPKNVSTPNRRERHRSGKQRGGGWKGGCNQWWQFPWRQWGIARATKAPLCACLSLDLLLTPCEYVTWGQVPRSPNNTSSHPENLPFQPLVPRISSREERRQSTGWKPHKHCDLTLCHKEGKQGFLLQIALMSSKSHTD